MLLLIVPSQGAQVHEWLHQMELPRYPIFAAALGDAEFPSNSRRYQGGRTRVEATARVPAESHAVSAGLLGDTGHFCRNRPIGFDAVVYRNSTGDLGVAKSSAKSWRLMPDMLLVPKGGCGPPGQRTSYRSAHWRR